MAERDKPGLADQDPAIMGGMAAEIERLSEDLAAEVDRADPVVAQMMKIKQLAWEARDAGGTELMLSTRVNVPLPVSIAYCVTCPDNSLTT